MGWSNLPLDAKLRVAALSDPLTRGRLGHADSDVRELVDTARLDRCWQQFTALAEVTHYIRISRWTDVYDISQENADAWRVVHLGNGIYVLSTRDLYAFFEGLFTGLGRRTVRLWAEGQSEAF